MSRCLDREDIGAVQTRIAKTSGFPSWSMALLGSAFRAIARFASVEPAQSGSFVAGIGTDLGLRTKNGPIFQNLSSLVPICARADELGDREKLLGMLNRQMRQRLEEDADLGVLQWVSLFGRRPEQAGWVIEHMLRYSFSLWYAYFGALDSVGARFCDADIENVYFAGPSWSPVGLTLLVNQFRGRLLFQLTYVPASVPETLANSFLDELLRDLLT